MRYVTVQVIPIDSIVGQVNKVVLDICMMLVILLTGKPDQAIFVEVQPMESYKKVKTLLKSIKKIEMRMSIT